MCIHFSLEYEYIRKYFLREKRRFWGSKFRDNS